VSAAHVGWLHIWRLSERARLSSIPATLTDDAMLSRRYFQEAVALDPTDARYLGFLAGATLAEGNIHQDERLTRRGYFMMQDAIKAWPEFNLFTAGYVMSTQPVESERFKQALQWQWQNLDVCVGETVDRRSADYAKYMTLETREGKKRCVLEFADRAAQFEGFFLNMGDMLVKAGTGRRRAKFTAMPNCRRPTRNGSTAKSSRTASAMRRTMWPPSMRPSARRIAETNRSWSPPPLPACPATGNEGRHLSLD